MAREIYRIYDRRNALIQTWIQAEPSKNKPKEKLISDKQDRKILRDMRKQITLHQRKCGYKCYEGYKGYANGACIHMNDGIVDAYILHGPKRELLHGIKLQIVLQKEWLRREKLLALALLKNERERLKRRKR